MNNVSSVSRSMTDVFKGSWFENVTFIFEQFRPRVCVETASRSSALYMSVLG